MKPSRLFLCFALCLSLMGIGISSRAAEEPTAAAGIDRVPFTLLIVGTRHYSDVDIMSKNITRIPKVQRLVQTVSSQNHIQFSGLYGGVQDSLVADIRGLAADRFEVQTRDDKARGLVITLRKIQGDGSPSP